MFTYFNCALIVAHFFQLVNRESRNISTTPEIKVNGVQTMFYERFAALCAQRGISPSRAAEDAGLSKSTVTKWKRSPDSRPTGAVLEKLAQYFGVTVADLLGEPKTVRDEDVKFALFGGSGDITDEMYQEVLRFADYVRQREMEKKEKS